MTQGHPLGLEDWEQEHPAPMALPAGGGEPLASSTRPEPSATGELKAECSRPVLLRLCLLTHPSVLSSHAEDVAEIRCFSSLGCFHARRGKSLPPCCIPLLVRAPRPRPLDMQHQQLPPPATPSPGSKASQRWGEGRDEGCEGLAAGSENPDVLHPWDSAPRTAWFGASGGELRS